MSNIKELIRAEIERLIRMNQTKHGLPAGTACAIRIEAYKRLLDFLDTLPDEEQPTKGYDEAYLNEKIVKASKSWEGVDVDKFMDEVRGREPVTTCDQLGPVTDCHELEEAAENYIAPIENDEGLDYINFNGRDIKDAFIAGAEWQKRKQPKVKGYGVMRKMEDPHPDDWYMDERGKEHCWGYKFNEPCPWPAEVYIMEAKEGAEQ